MSLFGVAIGGGLFLIIIAIGVIVYTTRQRVEDAVVMEAACGEGKRRRGRGISMDVWGKENKKLIEQDHNKEDVQQQKKQAETFNDINVDK